MCGRPADALHYLQVLSVAAVLECIYDVQPRAAEGSMIRKLFLVFAVLAVLVTPRPAHGRGGGHGGHGHNHSRHHGYHFIGVIYAPFPYGSPCWAEDGFWIDQLYMDRYGTSAYVPLWVPPRWGCWY